MMFGHQFAGFPFWNEVHNHIRMRKAILVFVLGIFSFSLTAQTLVTANRVDKKAKRIKRSVVRKITNHTWEEYKRVYHIRGNEREYNYSGKRLLKIGKDSSFVQADQVGRWEVHSDGKILHVEAELESSDSTDTRQVIGSYMIYKASKRDLVLVKPLSANTDDKIIYYYRKSSLDIDDQVAILQSGVKGVNRYQYQTQMNEESLKKKSKDELIKMIRAEYFRRSTAPPRNLTKKTKDELVDLLSTMYN